MLQLFKIIIWYLNRFMRDLVQKPIYAVTKIAMIFTLPIAYRDIGIVNNLVQLTTICKTLYVFRLSLTTSMNYMVIQFRFYRE